ncbi:PilZ domain-containing protein [Pseudoalteromonas sp. 2CM32C]|uniref:PilZ domain-containing protein n=1 Tax=Pseudoalteromonas sp. 2CM32C TaxID=2929852 RepID=UPI0020C16DC1|nr:PilZ domain-containing protein [Pseudoalteromonas sp. 2CM32C]MCK8121249.1 PilZ domain-containing protein [Pseudoalteromonas sp. 2CM32C]
MQERRQFSRILFSTDAHIIFQENEYPCTLLDISLHGALISKCDVLNDQTENDAILRFILPDSEIEIKMETTICHIEANHIGLKCKHIDIDSITYLKRLIELNLADDELLHRELAMLIHDSQK